MFYVFLALLFIAGQPVEPVSLSVKTESFLFCSLNLVFVFFKGFAALILVSCALAQLADTACWHQLKKPRSKACKYNYIVLCYAVMMQTSINIYAKTYE